MGKTTHEWAGFLREGKSNPGGLEGETPEETEVAFDCIRKRTAAYNAAREVEDTERRRAAYRKADEDFKKCKGADGS